MFLLEDYEKSQDEEQNLKIEIVLEHLKDD